METESRADWSRASRELCRAAQLAVIRQHGLLDLLDGEGEHDDQQQHLQHSRNGNDDRNERTPLVAADGRPTAGAAAAPPCCSPFYGTDDDTTEDANQAALRTNGHGHPQREPATTRWILWDETNQMVSLAVPVIGTYLLEMLPGIVSIVLVGHVESDLTKEYIAAASLAVMYVNLTGLSVGFGLASAMDTLCSQAYGAGQVRKMGVYLQTGLLVLSAAFVVVFLLNYHAGTILLAIGQPPRVSALAGTFTRILIPGIPFLFVYELLRKTMQAQNVAMPMFYVAVLSNVVNCVLGYYLVYRTPLGWLGSAVARTACNVSFCVFMAAYVYWSGFFLTFWGDGWHLKAAWKGVPQFVNLGIPGALQLCFEWWAFEVLAVISGLLPDAVLAIGVNAILLNLSSMVYMLYLGVSIAANVRIGNALGSGLPRRANLAAKLAVGLAAVCAAMCAVFLLAFHESLPTVFTHDPEIGEYCSRLLFVAAAFQLPDAINGAVQGILKGSGRQSIGAYLNFVAYYVAGIPFGILLAFHFEMSV